MHGNWSDWRNVTACSKSCGGGELNQTRTCTNPAPSNGGEDCKGESVRSKKCNLQLCPGRPLHYDNEDIFVGAT